MTHFSVTRTFGSASEIISLNPTKNFKQIYREVDTFCDTFGSTR